MAAPSGDLSVNTDSVKTALPERKITFPADSILNAVIQDGDIQELLRILRYQRSEIDLNQANHVGLTALHHAVLANNLDSVKILLNNGANIHVQDIHGFSPLHTAAALGFLQITTLLIVFGGDVFSLTKQSELPVDVAKDVNVIRVLINEMCLKLHREMYVSSFLCLRLRQGFESLQGFVRYIVRTLFVIIVSVSNFFLSRVKKLPSTEGLQSETRDRHIATETVNNGSRRKAKVD